MLRFYSYSLVWIFINVALVFLSFQLAWVEQNWVLPTIIISFFSLELGLLIWSVFDIRLNGFTKAYCWAKTNEKIVGLTFDDGPDEYTPQILQTLKKHQAKASFFLIGNKIEEHSSTVKKIIDEGHIVGIHSFSHDFKFTFLTAGLVQDQIIKTNELIEKSGGKKTYFFRPPFGVTNNLMAKGIKMAGMQTIGWSLRSLDTKVFDEDKLIKRIIKRLKPGKILLLHDTTDSIAKKLDRLLTEIARKGYRIEPIDNLLNIKWHE